jgi:hypothetical protein
MSSDDLSATGKLITVVTQHSNIRRIAQRGTKLGRNIFELDWEWLERLEEGVRVRCEY